MTFQAYEVVYRDLLALADAISEMKSAASAALTNVESICGDFDQIKAAPFSNEAKQVCI